MRAFDSLPIDWTHILPTIIPLAEIDPELVESLLDAAFGKDRMGRTAYKVREGMEMLEGLSIAAVDMTENELLGSLQCWPAALTDEEGKMHPMIMVGPVAVHPDCQRQGIGRAMIDAMLKELHRTGGLQRWRSGDPPNNDRSFGSWPGGPGGWNRPGRGDPDRR